MTKRQKQWLNYALVTVLVLVSGYFGVRYPLPDMPEYAELEMRTAALEAIAGIEMQAVGPTRFRSITVDHVATVGESLTVPDITASDDLVVTDDAAVGGDLTVTGSSEVGGNITLENGEVISNSTDGDVFVNGDLLGFTNVVSKAESYTQLNVETGSLYANIGAGAGYTWTLPAAATGLRYCYYLAVTQIITISPAAADLIHHLTNSAGDRITNTVAGDTLCLTAIDDVNWVPSNETGNWNDIN